MFHRLAILVTILLLTPAAVARAACTPVTPVACPNCFAVFVMPDTQLYTLLANQPAAGNHLDLVTRYICENRVGWTEPTTGKTMPILMVVQLGDLVQRADYTEPVAGPLAEWHRVSDAFENLDQCSPRVPYIVTNGNHDVHGFNYERRSNGYSTFFGPDRWIGEGVACDAPNDCNWNAGQYFIGGGDTIKAFTRNSDTSDGGSVGPQVDALGRHRAATIKAPNGQRFLFLGLELAFDFPPAFPGFEGVERDDSAWPKQLLAMYPNVPTIVFHHSMLWVFPPPDTRLRWGPERWRADSISYPPFFYGHPDYGTSGGMEDLYNLLIEPYSQVQFLFTGHVYDPTHQADYTIARAGGKPPVHAFLRDFQRIEYGLAGDTDMYGIGWNVIAVFDPDAQEVRVRSYRIDDVENYAVPPTNYDHVGTPAATECLDTDENGVGERVIPWDFQPSGLPTTPSLSAPALLGLASLIAVTAVWTTVHGSRKP